MYYQSRKEPDKPAETQQELTPEEVQQQIKEEGEKGPTVDPETIPVTG
jgi:hypothetical protein